MSTFVLRTIAAVATVAGSAVAMAQAIAPTPPGAAMADPLAELRDIHMPAPVGWWPPAPGWWLLAAALLVLLGLAAYFGVRRFRRQRYRRIARRQLEALYAQWQQQRDDALFLRELNQLLKQAALHAFAAERVAPLHGAAWLRFLDSTLRKPVFDDPALQPLADLYAPDAAAGPLEADALRRAAAHWLRRHRC